MNLVKYSFDYTIKHFEKRNSKLKNFTDRYNLPLSFIYCQIEDANKQLSKIHLHTSKERSGVKIFAYTMVFPRKYQPVLKPTYIEIEYLFYRGHFYIVSIIEVGKNKKSIKIELGEKHLKTCKKNFDKFLKTLKK